MSSDQLLNELIIEEELFKSLNFILKKKESFQKLILQSLNESNEHFNKIFQNLIQRQQRLFNDLHKEKCRYSQKFNDHLFIEKLWKIYLKLKKKKKKRKDLKLKNNREDIQILIDHLINEVIQQSFHIESNDQTLTIYWKHISTTNNLHKQISSYSHLNNHITNHSLTNSTCNFTKLEKLHRIYPQLN